MKILILEDDLRLANDWRRHLITEGHDVVHVVSVEDAWHFLDNGDVDLVIADIFIRGEDGQIVEQGGISLLGQIRIRLRQQERPKCIAVSGAGRSIYNPYGPMSIVKSFGIDATLSKPITLKELSAEIAKLFD